MSIRCVPIEQLTPAELCAWSELQRADEQFHNPFFRPEFAQLVGQATGQVEVAILAREDEPVGFFPFRRTAAQRAGPIGAEISDMQGIVLKTGVAVDANALLRACGLVTWSFDHLLAAQECFQSSHQIIDDSAYMELTQGYQSYRQARRAAGSQAIPQAERRQRKLAAEVGPVRFVWHTADLQVLATIYAWKRAQVQQKQYPDVFAHKHVAALLDLLPGAQDPSFQTVVSALYAGEELVAGQLGIRSYEILSAAIPAFNPRFAKYSPGMLLHLEQARQANENGITRIELGRGANQTKSSLMSGSVPLAIGAVDLRPLTALARKAWYRLRTFVYSTPLKRGPLLLYRRLRNRLQRGRL